MVAIVNSNDDVVEMLRLSFEQAGFVVVSVHDDAIKRGATHLTNFVRAHKPQVIVFDLVPPYRPELPIRRASSADAGPERLPVRPDQHEPGPRAGAGEDGGRSL